MVDSEQPEPESISPASAGETPGFDRTIVMVGLMGAGKSAVGRRLATRLNMPFVDADTEIETAAGCTIAEIFERHGEAAFRDGESRVIARLLEGPPIVLATGGGAFMDDDTRALVARTGISVWLRADLDTLVQRTAKRNHRPLLRDGDPAKTLKNLIAVRHPIYEQSDIVVESDDSPLDKTVDRVCKALDAYLARTSRNGNP
jgi:shikimate kinase